MNNEIVSIYNSITPRYSELNGQVAVVTGGALGIGQGIAIRLAREGIHVVLADLNQEALTFTTSALRSLNVNVIDFLGDMSQPESIRNLFETICERFNTVDFLVNNTADLESRRLLDTHETLLEHQLDTNIRGPYLCAYQAANIMREVGQGNIINITSVGALQAHHDGLPYDVTKGAINAMTRAMAIDLAEFNIRVNAVGPGVTRTYRTSPPDDPNIQKINSRIPLGRFGTVSDISSMVAFLASSDASYITGQVIYVDGGITAQLSPSGYRL
jgi:3-oxoacyl-[acyl-carrier protein] reductase